MLCSVCTAYNPPLVFKDDSNIFTVHAIPKDQQRARKWFKAFPNIKLNSSSKICCHHFAESDYENNEFGTKLKRNACPKSLNAISKNLVTANNNIDSNVCRVCLNHDDNVVVPINVCIQNRTVADMMNYVAGIEVLLNDNLPQFVCTDCIKLLVTACKIRELCIKSDTSLRWEYVNMNDVKEEPDENPDDIIIEDDDESYIEQDMKADYSEMQNESIEIDDPHIFEEDVKHDYDRNQSMEVIEYEGLEKLDEVELDYDTPETSRKIVYNLTEPTIQIPCSSKKAVAVEKKQRTSGYKRKYPKPVFKCYICGLEFDMRLKKNEHLNTEHADFDLSCKLCPKRFKTVIGIDYHLEVHEKPELLRHMCYICSQTFSRGWFLNVHLKYYHKISEEFYYCDLCPFKDVAKARIRDHIEVKHLKLKKNYTSTYLSNGLKREKAFACDKCPDKQYTTRTGLEMHKCVVHEMITNVQCSACLRYFPNKPLLNTHLKGNRCTKIPHAKARIINKVDVSIYREEVDSETYRCKICRKIFTGERRRDRISIHYSNMHKYVCEYCSSNFKNQALLDQHIENSHPIIIERIEM